MRKFKGILFDMDGLLVDSERVYHRVSYEMAAELGVDLNDGILSMQMGRSPLESMKIFISELGIQGYTAQALVDWRDKMMLKAYRESVDFMPGAYEILEASAKDFKLAIATGSTRNLVEVVIAKLGIEKMFDAILPSDEIVNGKPNPEIYLKAAKMLNLKAEECFVLEDSSNGCMAGHRAGCYVIAVPTKHTENQEFGFVDAIVSDLCEAKKFLNERRMKNDE